MAAISASSRAEDGKRWTAAVEGGAVWQGRNDARIPGSTGTAFSLADLQGRGARVSGRLTLTLDEGTSNRWRALAAPLRIRGDGALPGAVSFAGATYAGGTPTRGWYEFNSYRVTYMRRFRHTERCSWYFGATLKVRDARVALRQGSTASSDYNLGLVPLAHLSGDMRLGQGWRLSVDLDGLAAPQGRAFDLGIHAMRDIAPDWALGISYRTLEGGADNDNVYTFAWLNYVSVRSEHRF
jgi:hypothetical protein